MIFKQNTGQTIHRFENGYGASVIDHGYGSDEGLKEVGVLKFTGDKWGLTYETPITDDVLGWQSEKDVIDVLSRIESLTAGDIQREQIRRAEERIAVLQREIDAIREGLDA